MIPETRRLTPREKRTIEEKYRNQFIREAKGFYENSEILDQSIITCKINGRLKRSLAQLEIWPNLCKIRGRRLIEVSPTVILHLSRHLLSMCDEDVAKVIRHEVLHIGYHKHDKTFKRLCVEFNASYKGYNLSVPAKTIYFIETRKGRGKHWKLVFETHDKQEAEKEYYKQMFNKISVRLSMRRPATLADML